MLKLIVGLPQPLKTLYFLFFAAFAASFATFFLGSERTTSLAMGVLGAVAVLVGLTISTDLNGSVDAITEAMRSYRPFGVDYSRSVFASRGYSRIFGGLMLVVGTVFIIQAAVQL